MADTATPPLTAGVYCLSEQARRVSTLELVVAEDTVKGADTRRHDKGRRREIGANSNWGRIRILLIQRKR